MEVSETELIELNVIGERWTESESMNGVHVWYEEVGNVKQKNEKETRLPDLATTARDCINIGEYINMSL